jgi:hypothetical protein
MSEAELLTVSIHLRVSPLEAELIDLRLAYMAEDAASKNGKPTCKPRPNSSVTCCRMSNS